MKLVIDIPKEEYECVQITGCLGNKTCVSNAIYNGIPLDKIRAEIEEIARDYDKFADYRRVHGLWIALDIIDKYRAESDGEVGESE